MHEMKHRDKIKGLKNSRRLQKSEEEKQNIHKELGSIINQESTQGKARRLNPVLAYLDDRHGTIGSERKHLIDQMFKTVIDNIVPDYIKIIL